MDIFNLWALTELHFPRRKSYHLKYHHIIKHIDLIDANDLLKSWPAFDEKMQILLKDRVNVEVSVWEKPRKLKAVWRKGKVEIG